MAVNPKILGEGEHVVEHLRTHGKRLLVPVLVLLLTAVALGVGIAAVSRYIPVDYRSGAIAALAVLALIVVLWGVVAPWLRWLTTTYTFTNHRIITRRGILRRTGHDLPLTRINDVGYEMSILDRLFGCGTLVLQTVADDPVTLDDIPHVEKVHVEMTNLLFAATRGELADPSGAPREQ